MGDTEELAQGYTQANDTQFNAGLFLLNRLHLTPGMHVLDVGCGTGNLTAHIASLVGPTGRVTGVDSSAQRIRIATQLSAPNLSFAEGIAEDLSAFAAQSFDVVFVNSMLHWMQDQAGAMKEFARVLKAGGKLGISGGSGDFVTAQEEIKERVLSREPYAAHPEEAPPKFLKRREMEALLDEAGLAQREIVVNRIVKATPDADAMINWLDTSSSGKTYGGIPVELRLRVREEMKVEWEKIATAEGIRMEMELLVAVAVKSGWFHSGRCRVIHVGYPQERS